MAYKVRLRVKELAQERGYSMGKLSRVADVSFTQVKRLFRDPYMSPGLDTLVKLADALGVKLDDLIERVPESVESPRVTPPTEEKSPNGGKF